MKTPFGHISAVAAILIVAATASPAALAQAMLDELAGPQIERGGAAASRPRSGSIPVQQIQAVWDETCIEQRSLRVSPPVKRWRWSADDVLCIETRRHMRTVIVLPDGDVIDDILLGESYAFEVNRRAGTGSVLYVTPANGVVLADTSLHVTARALSGQRRHYQFYLRSYPEDHDAFTDQTVFVDADWALAERLAAERLAAERLAAAREDPEGVPEGVLDGMGDDALALVSAALDDGSNPNVNAGGGAGGGGGSRPTEEPDPPDFLRRIPFDIAALRFDEWSICPADEDSRKIAPVRVFNDGHSTFIDFGEDSDAILRTAIHRVVDESDNPVQRQVTGPRANIVVVHSVGYDLTLTNGSRLVCLKFRQSC